MLVEAASINIKNDQVTLCDMKDDTHRDKPTDSDSAVPLGSTEHFSLLSVLVNGPLW